MEKARRNLKIALFLTFIFFLTTSAPVFAQTADNYFDQGKAYLENGQLPDANNKFQQALNLDPNHQGANLFYAVTRILMISESSDFNTLLDRAGVSSSGRDVLNWTADFMRNPTGKILLPSNTPTSGELQTFIKNDVLPEVNGALSNLSKVTSSYQTTFELFTEGGTGTVNNPNTLTDNTRFWKDNEFVGFNIIVSGIEFTITSNTQNTITVNPNWSFPPGNYSYKIVEPVRIDYGDVLVFKGTLTLGKAGIYILTAYNLDVDIDAIVSLYNAGTLDIQTDIINAYSNLLTLLPDAQLAQAKSILKDAISTLTSAIDYIVSEPPSQEHDLIVIDDPAKEQEYRNLLTDFNSALDGPTLISTNWSVRKPL